jgi:hypothetical protein
MYNLRNETEEQPKLTKYETYVRNGTDFNNSKDPKLRHINGAKGVWSFDILPYANLIWMTKVIIMCYQFYILSCNFYVLFILFTCLSHTLFILFTCIGFDASLDLFAEELLDLWENPIVHEGVEYKVALIASIWDGKRYEKVTHTRGGSLHSG